MSDESVPLPPRIAADSLEERKFDLEKRKVEFELSKGKGLGLFNANFGIIITAMIGGATIAVSYLQLEINRQSSAQQLTLQKSISDAQLALEASKARAAKEKDERTLQFDIARLMLERQSDINTQEIRRVYYLRDIVMSALPNDMGLSITRKMASNSADTQLRSAWADGYVKLQIQSAPEIQSAPVSPGGLTVDYVVSRFPWRVGTQEARQRIAEILDAIKEHKLEDAAPVVLAVALSNTGLFRTQIENLNYSAARLAVVFPRQFSDPKDAAAFAGNPRAVANKVYGDRLGNIEPDDGWNYRGRGYLGTTGREAYRRSGTLLGVDLLKEPDKLLDGKLAAKLLAVAFAGMDKPITITTALRQLNGGYAGLAEVRILYERLVPSAPQITDGLSASQEDQ